LCNFIIHFYKVNRCKGCCENNEDADDGKGDVGIGVFQERSFYIFLHSVICPHFVVYTLEVVFGGG